MKKTERLVYFYDLSVRSHSSIMKNVKNLELRRAFELIETIPLSERTYPRGRERFYISDWNWDGAQLSILINRSDQGIADPIFSDPENKTRREIPKADGEGQDYSSHVIIRFGSDKATAVVLCEQCVGITSLAIGKLLRHVLKKAKKLSPNDFRQKHVDGSLDAKGQPRMVSLAHYFDLIGHLDASLKDDLNNGQISGIELITEREKQTEFDDDGFFREKQKIVSLGVSTGSLIQDKFESTIGLFKKHEDKYERARIRFKSPSGAWRTINWTKAEGFEQSYVRKERVDKFTVPLKSSYEQFNTELLVKMKKFS